MIAERLAQISKLKPCHISLEIDVWLSVRQKNTVASFNNYEFKKRSIVLNFIPTEDKTAARSTKALTDIVQEYKFKGLWVSTCSDNATNVINSTSELINNPDYPLCISHPGSICHIINLVCEDFIEGFAYYLKEQNPNKNLEASNGLENDDICDVTSDISLFPNNIISILNDPFDGKAPLIIRRVCRFRSEIRKILQNSLIMRNFVVYQSQLFVLLDGISNTIF